jgi:hypothetical protein
MVITPPGASVEAPVADQGKRAAPVRYEIGNPAEQLEGIVMSEQSVLTIAGTVIGNLIYPGLGGFVGPAVGSPGGGDIGAEDAMRLTGQPCEERDMPVDDK